MRSTISLSLLLLAGAAIAGVLSSAPAFAQQAAAAKAVELPEGVVATVNGQTITEAEWVETIKRVAGRSVLEFMVRHMVVRQAAAKQGIELSENELQEIFDKKVVEAGGIPQLETYLTRTGETLVDFKERLHTETLLRRMSEKDLAVSDEELRVFFLVARERNLTKAVEMLLELIKLTP